MMRTYAGIRLKVWVLMTPDITRMPYSPHSTDFNKRHNFFAGLYGELFNSRSLGTLNGSAAYNWAMVSRILIKSVVHTLFLGPFYNYWVSFAMTATYRQAAAPSQSVCRSGNFRACYQCPENLCKQLSCANILSLCI